MPEAAIRRLAQSERVRRRATLEVECDERLALAQFGLLPSRQREGALAGANDEPVRRSGRQEQHRSMRAGGREQRLTRRDTDQRDAEAMGHPLGRRDTDAQAGERSRARPDDDAGEPRTPDVLLAEEPPDRGKER